MKIFIILLFLVFQFSICTNAKIFSQPLKEGTPEYYAFLAVIWSMIDSDEADKEAYNYAKKALDKNPNISDAHYAMGALKARKNDIRGAMVDFNKAINLDPANEYAYVGRGKLKALNEDFRGAIVDFNKAIIVNPEDKMAYFYRGVARILMKDLNGGCLDLSKSGELGYEDAYDAIRKYCR